MNNTSGFNVYGYLTANVGLGVAARNTVQMLTHNQRKIRACNLDPGGHLGGGDTTLSALIGASQDAGPYEINLFHLNPDRLRYMISPFKHDLEERFNACVPFWEAPRLPRSWVSTLAAMDVVLAPTLFVRDAILADIPDARIVHYPQTVFLPQDIRPNRQRWGIPPDAIAFVTSFAIASDIERKNPWATLEAFSRAFADDPQTVLIVKVNNPKGHGHGSTSLDTLRQYCAARSNVTLIEESLSYSEILGLYDSCDVLVSLHRSEGLGLSLLEGMSLGKPVMGTAWSGNMDFMTADNSILAPFKLVDIAVPKTSPYHRSNIGVPAQWADADVEAAAKLMAQLARDPAMRVRIGEAGRAAADKTRAAFESGTVLGEIDAMVEKFRVTGHDLSRLAARKHLEKTYVIDYASRLARGLRRRILCQMSKRSRL